MPTSYSPLLGLALPVTGELAGTWGDTVNDYITKYLDSSVAGTQTISGSQTAVTLSVTNGTTLVQVGSGATGSAQYQVINCTGNPASLLTVTVPAQSKTYVVVNATSTSQQVKIVGTGPTTGVTLDAGEKAVIAWNGSDFIKVATSTVDGVSTISFGTTGLTPSTATSGAVTVAGTLVAANGGTGQSTYTTGDLLYATGSTALSKLGIGTNGQILTSTGTAPQWSTLSGVAVTTFSAGTTGFTPSSATSGAVTLAGTLATTNGGTGLTSFTANGVVYASSTSALTTGSALSFDGTKLTQTVSTTAAAGVAEFKNSATNAQTANIIASNDAGTALTMRVFGSAAGTYGMVVAGSPIISTTASELNFVADNASGVIKWGLNGAVEAMRLTSTGLGIGTTSPSYKLNVVGANGGTTNLFQVGINAVTNGFSINTDASNNIVYSFLTKTGAAGIYQDASGNVGIGTTSPNEKLVVSGGCLQVTGSLQSLNRPSSSVVDFLSGATRFFSIGADSSTYGSFSFRNATTTANTEVMAIDSAGNLGLGVTPSAWQTGANLKALQVGVGTALFSDTNSLYLGNNVYQDSVGTSRYINTNYASKYQQTSSVHSWYTAASGTAGNTISFTQAMTLDSSGNLGIGTSSPSQRLSVNSGASTTVAGFTSTGSAAYLALANSGATTFIGNDSTSGSFIIQTPSGGFSTKLTLDNSGNLGLGVTPSAWGSGFKAFEVGKAGSGFFSVGTDSLQVTNNYYYNGTNYIYAANGYAERYHMVTGQHIWFTAPSGTAGNTISFTQAMTLDASGNLGVGTTSPVQRLEVVSSSADVFQTIRSTSSSPTNVALRIQDATTGTGGGDGLYLGRASSINYLWTYENEPWVFATNNTERARITSTGTFQLTNNYQEGVLTANTGTAYTIDLVNGTLQILTLTGNCTFTFPTATAGQSFTMLLRQDGTGGRTVTWPAAVRWPGNTAPTITSTASQTDKYIFTADGTRWYGSNAGQAYVA